MKEMKEYNSIEEFIFINRRFPNVNESRQLYRILWDKYISTLADSDKKIAIENDKLQDYEDKKVHHDQKEVVVKIAKSTEKLKKLLENDRNIVSIDYGERWGIYSIYVVVNRLKRKELYKFRNNIPNFFEGWEVKLVPVALLEKIISFFRKTKTK